MFLRFAHLYFVYNIWNELCYIPYVLDAPETLRIVTIEHVRVYIWITRELV